MYEGKEITYFANKYPDGIRAIVVGCDKDIGITIVAKDDPEHFLSCLIGPSSPNADKYDMSDYDKFFSVQLRMIKEGFLDCRLVIEEVYGYGLFTELFTSLNPGPSAESCPFGQ